MTKVCAGCRSGREVPGKYASGHRTVVVAEPCRRNPGEPAGLIPGLPSLVFPQRGPDPDSSADPLTSLVPEPTTEFQPRRSMVMVLSRKDIPSFHHAQVRKPQGNFG